MSILGAIGGFIGSLFGKKSDEKMAEKNIQLQKDFAQQGIRWKVEDAKKAGIHPLYALGANTHSFSPVSVGSQDFAGVGQNLGSAIGAMTTHKEKADGFQKTVQDLTLQKMGLENEVLASQLRTMNQPGRGPGMPGGPTTAVIDGQPNSATTFQSGGVKILVNPSNTPAEKWEEQYGEIGGEIGGMSNFITDIFKQAGMESGPTALGAKARKVLADALAESVRKQSKTRDPVFNERFWQ